MALLRTSLFSTSVAQDASRSRAEVWISRGSVAVAASLFVGLCAHVSVSLPFSPVPFTLQPFAVLVVALLLSPALSFAAMAAYLLEGASGLPVFAPNGLGGVAQLMGPTGGYLLAYLAAAPVAGATFRSLRLRSRFAAAAMGGAAALTIVFCVGAAWLAMEMHLSAQAALSLGVVPFLPSEAVKLCAAAGIASAVRRSHV